MTRYTGSCHCGAIQFEIEGEITDQYMCDCSICRKRNGLMTTVHESKFKLNAGEDRLTLYQWNKRVARHYFCSVCGIYPFHRKRSMPDCYAVNVNCLDGYDPNALPIRRTDGKTMTVSDPNPRPDWTGPRE